MPTSKQPSILYVGNEPSLEYLLGRYAQRSGCQMVSVPAPSPAVDLAGLRPLSVWFSSVETLAASPDLRAAAASLDIVLVVCAAVADDARAVDLGVDYIFLHPVTYDYFVSTLDSAQAPPGEA